MSTLAPPSAVTEYSDAVRTHLADLDAEVLEELTGGLEADLTESWADRRESTASIELSDLAAEFGSPSDYAAELRAAAGIAPPTRSARPGIRHELAPRWNAARAEWARVTSTDPALAAILDVLSALRPLWWVLRAIVLSHLVFGSGSAFALASVVSSVVSIHWGRRRFGQARVPRAAGLIVNALAILVAVPVTATFVAQMSQPPSWTSWEDGYEQGWSDATDEGLSASSIVGEQPVNLFVYGPDGEPVEQAQIFDGNGNPFVLANPQTGTPWAQEDLDAIDAIDAVQVPIAMVIDRPLNVYPYSFVPLTMDWETGHNEADLSRPQESRWPAPAMFPVPGHALPAAENDGTAGAGEPQDQIGEIDPGDSPTD